MSEHAQPTAENGGGPPDSRQMVEMLDDALRTAREALNDIGSAKHLYAEFLDEVKQRCRQLAVTEEEFRETADTVVRDILEPAETSLEEILSIKKSLQNELEQFSGRVATTARLQAELGKGKERIERIQNEKEQSEARIAALERENQQGKKELDNVKARHAVDAEELIALRSDIKELREEIVAIREDRDRFRTMLGSVRTALQAGGQIDQGNLPDVLGNEG